ncbi:MAG TPA: hypothetical protein VJN94_03550 [Candidatus Binataceae bacterium]|nr:hypothetical protein [Candidatus Binataceae bacterium]
MKAKLLRISGGIGLLLGILTLSACFEAPAPYAYGPDYSGPVYAYSSPEYRYITPPPRVYAYSPPRYDVDRDRGHVDRDHRDGDHDNSAHHSAQRQEHNEHERGER